MMRKWGRKLLGLFGIGPLGGVKAPELGEAISAEKMKAEACGFIAIADREKGKTEIWLCTQTLMTDKHGLSTPKHTLRWDDYGLTWQAYRIQAFAPMRTDAD